MPFLEEGLAILETLVSAEVFGAIDLNKALSSAQSDTSLEEDYKCILSNPESYLVLQDQLPREPAIAKKWIEDTKHYFPAQSIDVFINDIPDDPHARFDNASLHFLLEDLGHDPSYNTTTSAYKPETLILIGAGNGRIARKLIQEINPKNIIILCSTWDEWVSSFYEVNWLDIWNRFCMDPDRTICALQSDNEVAMIAILIRDFLGSLDHAVVYLPPCASTESQTIHHKLMNGMIDRQVAYKGFAMDEYNMIYNSWNSLQQEPKIFRYPSTVTKSLDYLIVGSGPSLDSSLEFIKNSQNNYIIVACASNYGVLRRHGIDVDVLCLLERGDFMIEQYKRVQSEYGITNTKLLASTTTPHQIFELFDDTMLYFRPSLSPVSIFIEDPRQMLTNEGPQTVHTGVSFAFSQNAASITLCGVDLGAATQESKRAKIAIGFTSRYMNIEKKGNLRDTIFTTQTLLDAAIVMEQMVKPCAKKDIPLYNLSDGLYLEGWQPCTPSSAEFKLPPQQDKKVLTQWWDKQSSFSKNAFRANFKAANVRLSAFRLFSDLKSIIESINLQNWSASKSKLFALLDITDQYKFNTLCPRLIRGSLSRLILSINRQLIIMASLSEQKREDFLLKSLKILVNRIDYFQHEICLLFDQLEASSS